MRTLLFTTAAALLLASAANADGPNTGRNWDDSHMRTRHVSAPPPQQRTQVLVGEVASDQPLEARTLPEATWHSWARSGKSVTFGRQPTNPRGSRPSGITGGRRGGSGGSGSMGSTTRGLR